MSDLMTDLIMLGMGLGLFSITGLGIGLVDRLNRKGASR